LLTQTVEFSAAAGYPEPAAITQDQKVFTTTLCKLTTTKGDKVPSYGDTLLIELAVVRMHVQFDT